ncbi:MULTISPECIES: hypothetical protein [Pseudomonas syringae group]|uniref:Uncharacterized protein n=3 Tax=Pseudomonas syringae group TaxID=136849 RepID=F3GF73_PSESJ|nr:MULTISPECIES: hypothetical protein [Pseudomonas syringae group]EGH45723.1 hypothetical protein PSYPI_26819 [Pseudomonas syringae pv. pisi str. 1704B]RMU67683.1 hypothetical protein ALP24_02867 [Pseudomonas syringae pv. aptata]PYD08475.1 hypothetical protein DND62_26855 [Pseudomonas syringae pv. pisi]PYD24815.1 hypothetical protein DND58_26870 [Pseudomonas syringae pv. pisi]RML54839.1 hypothetical protein ALQ93_02407 [Pseudomonas syringae pv. pisi]
MSTHELVVKKEMTPAGIASDLLNVIKDIERSISESTDKTGAIEQRGMIKSMFASSKTDLIDISKSQNKINELMLGLIQEIITLNTMSYSFLAAVIGELEQRAKSGWTDSEGRFQELSETGQQFAGKAHDIFCKIAEGSKSTQTRIDLNKQDIDNLKNDFIAKAEVVQQSRQDIDNIKSVLTHKTAVVAKQSKDIGQIHSVLESKTERLSSIDKLLASKADRLASIDKLLEEKSTVDQSQDLAIKQILQALQDGQHLDQQRVMEIQALSQALGAQTEKTSAAVDALHARQARAVRGIYAASAVAVISLGLTGLRLVGLF